MRHTSVEASIRMRGQVEVHAVASEKLFGDREISGYPERRLKFGRTLIFATNMQNLTHYRIDRRALLDDGGVGEELASSPVSVPPPACGARTMCSMSRSSACTAASRLRRRRGAARRKSVRRSCGPPRRGRVPPNLRQTSWWRTCGEGTPTTHHDGVGRPCTMRRLAPGRGTALSQGQGTKSHRRTASPPCCSSLARHRCPPPFV